mmetsp:Transcript_8150/g.24101  ORF Transcript_8150/g.24101 Transcript_8150/m.24101 type:complete len:116 (+) Transcript_8150:305-652(+)
MLAGRGKYRSRNHPRQPNQNSSSNNNNSSSSSSSSKWSTTMHPSSSSNSSSTTTTCPPIRLGYTTTTPLDKRSMRAWRSKNYDAIRYNTIRYDTMQYYTRLEHWSQIISNHIESR